PLLVICCFQETVAGVITLSCKEAMQHHGISLSMEGIVNLQLSSKSVGVFEAFYNSVKPIQLISNNIEVAKAGKIPGGKTEIPFEFPLNTKGNKVLYETYHGVFVNIQKSLLPRFLIRGHLDATSCVISQPLTGEVVVEKSEVPVKSIELQLVRVETCGCAEGYARDATEIQNIQIAEGDVCHGLPIPIYMVFPRLFTCPTLETTNFKVGQ
ncbi:Vacuolar protein sorting-associated protein 26C, partial [Goodea atripinnis]